MALKFGRTSGITSRVDPKTGEIIYNEDDYNANIAAKEAEGERRKAYDAKMAQFKKDSDDYFGKSTVDTKAAAGAASVLNKSNVKNQSGANVTFSGAKKITKAEEDKIFDAKLKNKEIVSIDDPSISEKTRELLRGANRVGGISGAYVRTGTNFTDYSQIYGDDYNPIRDRGKVSQYGSNVHTPKDEAGLSFRNVTPVRPDPYVAGPTLPDIDPTKVEWNPVKPMDSRPKLIDQKKYGKLRPAKEEEVPTWEAPILEKKKATHMRGTRITGSTVTDKGKYVKSKTGIENAARIKISDAVVPQRIKYNTEKRQSAAYYGNETVTGEKITGKTASELKSLKQEVKGDVKRIKGEGRLKDARDVRGDLPQIRKAIRYAEKAEGGPSELRYFTKDAMDGYKDVQKYNNTKVKEQQYGSYLNQTFKGQADNATNNNTVANQQAKLGAAAADASPTSFYNTRSQMKEKYATDNPTATPRQIRQGVRTEAATNRQTLKQQAEDMKAKGMIK